MAGIGFALRQVVAEDNYSSIFKGYIAATIISSGPWLITLLSMAILKTVSFPTLEDREVDLFFATVTYCHIFSLITTGIFQLVLARMLGDLHFRSKLDQGTPILTGLLVVLMPIQMASITTVFALSGMGLTYSLLTGTTYMAASGIWLVMIFLSAARSYSPILRGFGIGYGISFGASYGLGYSLGLNGVIAGFALGHSVTFIMLWQHTLSEFGPSVSLNFSAFHHLFNFPSLAIVGFCYHLGIMIDNMMLWYTTGGLHIGGLIYIGQYDVAKYLAFLTIIPAFALFVTQMETRFFVVYREFYFGLINEKLNLSGITKRKNAMANALRLNFISLIRLQLLVILFSTVLSPHLLDFLGITGGTVRLQLQLHIISAGLHVFLYTTVVILLYYDMRGSAVLVTLAFVLTNIMGTALTIVLGEHWYGSGLLAAEIVATILALWTLVNRFQNLEYLTFIRQPIN